MPRSGKQQYSPLCSKSASHLDDLNIDFDGEEGLPQDDIVLEDVDTARKEIEIDVSDEVEISSNINENTLVNNNEHISCNVNTSNANSKKLPSFLREGDLEFRKSRRNTELSTDYISKFKQLRSHSLTDLSIQNGAAATGLKSDSDYNFKVDSAYVHSFKSVPHVPSLNLDIAGDSTSRRDGDTKQKGIDRRDSDNVDVKTTRSNSFDFNSAYAKFDIESARSVNLDTARSSKFLDTARRYGLDSTRSEKLGRHSKNLLKALKKYKRIHEVGDGTLESFRIKKPKPSSTEQEDMLHHGLASQRYSRLDSPYRGGGNTEVTGIKQWQKPKKTNIYEYSADAGYLTPLRVVKSSEDFAFLVNQRRSENSGKDRESSNPYIDTHNEIMARKSANSLRRYRPKSVAEQFRTSLSSGSTTREGPPLSGLRRSDTAFEEPGVNERRPLSHAQQVYLKRMQATLGMSPALRSRSFTRGML